MRFARPFLLLPGVLLLLLNFAGCGMSQEDKDFYLGGWVRPTDLDKPSPAEARRQQALAQGSTTSQFGSAGPAPLPAPAPAREAVPAIEFQ